MTLNLAEFNGKVMKGFITPVMTSPKEASYQQKLTNTSFTFIK